MRYDEMSDDDKQFVIFMDAFIIAFGMIAVCLFLAVVVGGLLECWQSF